MMVTGWLTLVSSSTAAMTVAGVAVEFTGMVRELAVVALWWQGAPCKNQCAKVSFAARMGISR